MSDSLGHQSNLCFDTVDPIDTSSIPFIFMSENLVKTASIIGDEFSTGSRFQNANFDRKSTESIRGPIEMPCTPGGLAFLAPYILGGTESPAGTFNMGETLPALVGMIDKIADAYSFDGMYVNRCTIQGSAGQRIRMEIEFVCLDMTKGETYPVLTIPVTAQWLPLVFPADSVITLAAVATPMRDFELVIDNKLEEDFRNTVLAGSIDPINKAEITLKANLVWNSTTEAAYYEPSTDIWEVTGGLALTNGAVGVTFQFDTVQIVPKTPAVSGLGRIPFNVQMGIKQKAGTQPLTMVIDSTP